MLVCRRTAVAQGLLELRLADYLGFQVLSQRQQARTAGDFPEPAGDRVMVLVEGEPWAEVAVRQARRIADALRAPFAALHVKRLGAAGGEPSPALRLAKTRSAETETVVATELPCAILQAARARNVTHHFIGPGCPRLWRLREAATH
ncbi:hypothetical protein ACFQX4_12300 [Roseomonas sp. GCM10028921]